MFGVKRLSVSLKKRCRVLLTLFSERLRESEWDFLDSGKIENNSKPRNLEKKVERASRTVPVSLGFTRRPN